MKEWTTLHEDIDLIAAREVKAAGLDLVALIQLSEWNENDDRDQILARVRLIGGELLEKEATTVAHQDRLWAAFAVHFHNGATCPVAHKVFDEGQWDEAEAWAKARIDEPEFPLEAYLDAVVNLIGTTGMEAMEGNLAAGLERVDGDPFRKGKITGVELGKDVFGPSAPAHIREAHAVSYIVDAGNMDTSCWGVQIRGLVACESCQYVGTEDCGGAPAVLITHRRFPKRFGLEKA